MKYKSQPRQKLSTQKRVVESWIKSWGKPRMLKTKLWTRPKTLRKRQKTQQQVNSHLNLHNHLVNKHHKINSVQAPKWEEWTIHRYQENKSRFFSKKRTENHINMATKAESNVSIIKNHGQTTTNKLHKWRQYHYKHCHCRLWLHYLFLLTCQ